MNKTEQKVKRFIEKLKENHIQKAFALYVDETGIRKNFIYENGEFFIVCGKGKKMIRLSYDLAFHVLKSMRDGDYQVIGFGQLAIESHRLKGVEV